MRAPINKPFPTPIPKPLPVPPQVPQPHCHLPGPIDVDKLKDNIEFAGKDKDGNGALNRDEFDGVRGYKCYDPTKFGRYDKDDDGYVTRDEYHAGKQAESHYKAATGKLGLPEWKPMGTKELDKEIIKCAEGAKDVVKDVIKDIF